MLAYRNADAEQGSKRAPVCFTFSPGTVGVDPCAVRRGLNTGVSRPPRAAPPQITRRLAHGLRYVGACTTCDMSTSSVCRDSAVAARGVDHAPQRALGQGTVRSCSLFSCPHGCLDACEHYDEAPEHKTSSRGLRCSRRKEPQPEVRSPPPALAPPTPQQVADQQGESGKQAIFEAPFVRLRPEAAPRPSWLCERVQKQGAGAARGGESIAAAGVKKGLVARAHTGGGRS